MARGGTCGKSSKPRYTKSKQKPQTLAESSAKTVCGWLNIAFGFIVFIGASFWAGNAKYACGSSKVGAISSTDAMAVFGLWRMERPQSMAMQVNAKQRKARQCKARHSNAKQGNAKQSKAVQSTKNLKSNTLRASVGKVWKSDRFICWLSVIYK